MAGNNELMKSLIPRSTPSAQYVGKISRVESVSNRIKYINTFFILPTLLKSFIIISLLKYAINMTNYMGFWFDLE